MRVSTRHNRMLGIAVGQRSMLIAEVSAGAQRPQVRHAAEFEYPQGHSLQEPAALGAALAQFLKSSGISARGVVFGLPAKWVLSRRSQVPASDPQLMAQTIRLQAEGQFSPELNDLVYDYEGGKSAGESVDVLLMAAPRQYVSQLTELAKAARLNVEAITVSGTTLAMTGRPDQRDAMVLLVGPGGVELCARQRGQPRALRYLGGVSAPPAQLSGELRRAAAIDVANGTGALNGDRKELLLWHDATGDRTSFEALGRNAGMNVRCGELSDLGVDSSAIPTNGLDYATPVALALRGLEGRESVDFVHSRLAAPPARRIGRQTILIAVGVAVIILAFCSWAWSLHQRQLAVDAAAKARDDNKASVQRIQEEVDRIELGRRWITGKTRFVDCLRDLTLVGPRNNDLFGTTLDLRDQVKASGTSKAPKGQAALNLPGTFSGKAVSEQAVFDLRERLKSGPPAPAAFRGKFQNVQIVSMEGRQVPNAGREISFKIGFDYVPSN